MSLVQWLQQDNKGLSALSGKLKHVTTTEESPECNVAELARKLKQLETTAKLYDQKVSTDVTKGSKFIVQFQSAFSTEKALEGISEALGTYNLA